MGGMMRTEAEPQYREPKGDGCGGTAACGEKG